MDCICEECGREYTYARRLGCTRKRCNSCHSKHRRFKIKKIAAECMGNKCYNCGYDECLGALDFHHVNEKNKDFSISGASDRSWVKLKKELSKCVLLCANCHRRVHHTCINYNCKTEQLIINTIPEYNFPDFITQIAEERAHIRAEVELAIALTNEERELKFKKIKENLINSGIDFTKIGWVSKAAKIIDISPQKTRAWIKRNLPIFYDEQCGKHRIKD